MDRKTSHWSGAAITDDPDPAPPDDRRVACSTTVMLLLVVVTPGPRELLHIAVPAAADGALALGLVGLSVLAAWALTRTRAAAPAVAAVG